MKCYVCGTEIGRTEDRCRCCGEYVVDIIGDDAGTEKVLREKGEKRRNKLLSQYKIDVAAYKWADGKSEKVKLPIDSAENLFHREKWLDDRFARVPEVEVMDMGLIITKNGEEKEATVKMESFQSPTFLHIGAVVEDGFRVKLILKNDSGETHLSDEVALLEV